MYGQELGQSLADAAKATPNPPVISTEAQGRTAMRQWVREDLTAYIASSQNRFNAYKTGGVISSDGHRNWACGVMPAMAKNCWVVEGDTQSTLSCLLLEASERGLGRALPVRWRI